MQTFIACSCKKCLYTHSRQGCGCFVAEARAVSGRVDALLTSCAETRELVVQIRKRLADLHLQVDVFRRQCPSRYRPLCETVDTGGLDVVLRLDAVRHKANCSQSRIWSGEDFHAILLRREAVWTCSYVSVFRRNTLLPSSELEVLWHFSPEDGGTMFLRNIDMQQQVCTASQYRPEWTATRLRFCSSLHTDSEFLLWDSSTLIGLLLKVAFECLHHSLIFRIFWASL